MKIPAVECLISTGKTGRCQVTTEKACKQRQKEKAVFKTHRTQIISVHRYFACEI